MESDMTTASGSTTVPCFLDTELHSGSYVTIAILILLTIIICGGNGFTIFVFVRNRRLRTMNNFYIINLAIADFGMGLYMPFRLITIVRPELLQIMSVCLLRFGIFVLFACASIFGLLGLTLDRYLAITVPLRYHDIMTFNKYFLLGTAIWVPAFIIGLIIPMFWHGEFKSPSCPVCHMNYVMKKDYWRVIALPMFATVTALLIALYGHIFRVAKRQLNSIKDLDVNAQNQGQEWKLVKAGLMVFLAFYACWLPLFVILGIQYYGGDYSGSTYLAGQYAAFLCSLNSAINPIIYVFRLQTFKAEFLKMIGKTMVHEINQMDMSVTKTSAC